jgi:predicted short-subunit dehydrogenase-like oxidoreductase (DUF2520 family)
MSKPVNIVIIGTGYVANAVADSFKDIKDLHVVQVFNHRNSKEAKQFSKQLKCELITDYNAVTKKADLYILAVKDDAIAEVAKNLAPLKLKGAVVHTSGSIDISLLKKSSSSIGVYYPLQTFYKGAKIDWRTTPILIEANSKSALKIIARVAVLVSGKAKEVSSKKRLQIHLAAVFACNFTNAMYVSAYEIIEKGLSKKDTALLHPIMLQSFQKLQTISPKEAQTGPAKRNDKTVMHKHLQLLKDDQQLCHVYAVLTDLIMKQQNTE